MLEPIVEVSTAQTNLTDEKLSSLSQIIFAGGDLNQLLIDNGTTEEELRSALSEYHLRLSQLAGEALTGGTRRDGIDYPAHAASVGDVLSAPHTIQELSAEILRLKNKIRSLVIPRAA